MLGVSPANSWGECRWRVLVILVIAVVSLHHCGSKPENVLPALKGFSVCSKEELPMVGFQCGERHCLKAFFLHLSMVLICLHRMVRRVLVIIITMMVRRITTMIEAGSSWRRG